MSRVSFRIAALLLSLALLPIETAGAKGFGIILGAEAVLSLPSQNKTVSGSQQDKIGFGARGGGQLGITYKGASLVSRLRWGGSTLYSSPPDFTLDMLVEYELPLPTVKVWLGAGYSALFPSVRRELNQRLDPYHGFVATLGNKWTAGFFSEYSVAYYPHNDNALSLRESITDITVSIGYRFSFP